MSPEKCLVIFESTCILTFVRRSRRISTWKTIRLAIFPSELGRVGQLVTLGQHNWCVQGDICTQTLPPVAQLPIAFE